MPLKTSFTKCGRFTVGLHAGKGWSLFLCVCPFKVGFPSGALIRLFAHPQEFHYYLCQSTFRFPSLALISSFKPQNYLSVCWIFPPGSPIGTFPLQMTKTNLSSPLAFKNFLYIWCFSSLCHHSSSWVVIVYLTSLSHSLSFSLPTHAHASTMVESPIYPQQLA